MEKKRPKETMDLRYRGSLPLQRYRAMTIGIAGLGAIGRQVATLLASMGHKKLWGADFDKVELKNLGTQGWSYKEIGWFKVEALSVALVTKHSSFKGFATKFEEVSMLQKRDTNVFFCCVDNMAARIDIWNQITNGPRVEDSLTEHFCQCGRLKACDEDTCGNCLKGLYIDARMIPGVIRVLATDLSDVKARKYYESTLYNDNQAFEGACTDRMTMFGAYIAGGLMVSQLVNWLNGIPLVRDFLLETQRMTSTYLDPEAKKMNAKKMNAKKKG